mgnify:CR=1 FL=1
MNSKIQQFLDNYTNEDGWGHFTKTRTLHKVRDNLTAQDWQDIQDEAMYGFWELPNNLRISLTSKFNRLIEWQLDNGYDEFVTAETIPQIMADTFGTKHYTTVQQLVWGVLTSCIEAIHYNQQNIEQEQVIDLFE